MPLLHSGNYSLRAFRFLNPIDIRPWIAHEPDNIIMTANDQSINFKIKQYNWLSLPGGCNGSSKSLQVIAVNSSHSLAVEFSSQT